MLELLRLLNGPCCDIAALVSKAMDTELPRTQRWAVRIHLLYCRACRGYRRHIQLLRGMVRIAAERVDMPGGQPQAEGGRAAPDVALSPEAHQRIRQAIANR